MGQRRRRADRADGLSHPADLLPHPAAEHAQRPRHCIGETFSLYEMLIHLYKVARRYRLVYVPDKPLELEAQINLRTRYPLHMRLEAR